MTVENIKKPEPPMLEEPKEEETAEPEEETVDAGSYEDRVAGGLMETSTEDEE